MSRIAPGHRACEAMTERPRAEPARDPAEAKGAGQCVVCGRPRDPAYAPFCSKRCADVDLHRWLKGTYVIPGGEPAGQQDDEEP